MTEIPDSGAAEVTPSEVNQTVEDTQDVTKFSDDELSSLLKPSSPAPVTETEPAKETEKASPVSSSKDATEAKGPTDAETPKAEEKPQDPAVLQKRINDQLLLIGRQAQELGDLRKRLKADIDAKRQGLDERYVSEPAKAVRDELDIRERETQIKSLEAQERQLYARQVVDSHVELNDEVRQAMVETLARDKLPEEFIYRFAADPYSAGNPETIIQLAKRAQAEKHVVELLAIAQEQAKEIEKLRGNAQSAVKKVAQTLRAVPELTNAASGATSTGAKSYTEEQIANLPDAELAELLKG